MQRWWIYIQERFFVAGQLIVACGMSLSAWSLSQVEFSLGSFFLSFFGFLFTFSYLRLKNDFDDIDKDRIAHRERPLPQKVLTVPQVRRALSTLWTVMISYVFVLAFALNLTAAVMFALIIGYIWLWDKGFYAKHWLEIHPLVDGVMKQETVLLLVFFAIACQSSKNVFNPETLSYALVVFGAFFTHDICRKLDPFAHPIIKGYVRIYGFKRAFYFAAVALFISCVGAFGLGVELYLVPFQIAVIISLSLLFIQPRQFKLAEGISTVSLLVHMFAGFFSS